MSKQQKRKQDNQTWNIICFVVKVHDKCIENEVHYCAIEKSKSI